MEILLAMLLILLALVGGLVFFWLLPLKMVARLAHRHGHSAPCPSSLAWLVNNPIRRRYMRPLLDRVGIRPGERVLELGPGPGTFTVDAARRAGPGGRLIAVDIQPEMIAELDKRVREAACPTSRRASPAPTNCRWTMRAWIAPFWSRCCPRSSTRSARWPNCAGC